MPGSPVARAIAKCSDARLNPASYASGQYQGFRWVEALDACLVARAATNSPLHRDTAIKYWQALLDDADTIGDANGPRYPNTTGPATPVRHRRARLRLFDAHQRRLGRPRL